MTEFTPGPWQLKQHDHNHWAIQDSGVKVIANLISNAPYQPNTIELPANARLIAAAPDLLAALEDALRPFSEPTRNPGGNPIGEPDWCKTARAAIAKARGE